MVSRGGTALLCLCLCLLGSGIGESPVERFSELFGVVTRALAASGAQDAYTRLQNRYPPQGISYSVYGALQTITRNDDLECVPRLLCEAVAGGYPGSSRQLNLDKYSLSKLVSYLELDANNVSPMLTFGRAVVLGLSNRGDPYSCIVNYPKCPRDETRLLHYLNNHRGGFFRFFDAKPTHQHYDDDYYYHHHHRYQHRKPGKPGFDGKRTSVVAFPSARRDSRIRVGGAETGSRFVFADSSRRSRDKTYKDSSHSNAIDESANMAADRLPSKFHFGDSPFFPRD